MRAIFATLGSLGDVRPMAAFAAAAQRGGVSVKFATSPSFESTVLAADLEYVRFGDDAYFDQEAIRAGIVHESDGFSFWMGWSNLQRFEELYDRLCELCMGADFLVSTPFVMAAHLVSYKLGIPLINCCLSPASLISNADGVQAVDPHAREWRVRLNALRARLSLPSRIFPQMDRFAAHMTLGMYPRVLGGDVGRSYVRKPLEVGYPTLPLNAGSSLSNDLASWLSDGPYALVSFGSYIDRDAKSSFAAAVAACEALDLRCLYVSPHAADRLMPPSERVRLEAFVPHPLVMPDAAVVIHHGGVGTLAAAIEARAPMVVTPFGLDQLFNASCLAKQDLADIVSANRVTADSLKVTIERALDGAKRRAQKWSELDHGVGPHMADLAFHAMAEGLKGILSS